MNISQQAQAEAERLLKTSWSTVDLHTSLWHLTLPKNDPLSAQELTAMAALFTSRDHAIRAGIVIRGEKFAVHQWETARGVRLVYGRRGNAVSGCGACVCCAAFSDGSVLHGAVTYKFPSLSTNAVAHLVEFLSGLGAVERGNDDLASATVETTSIKDVDAEGVSSKQTNSEKAAMHAAT